MTVHDRTRLIGRLRHFPVLPPVIADGARSRRDACAHRRIRAFAQSTALAHVARIHDMRLLRRSMKAR